MDKEVYEEKLAGIFADCPYEELSKEKLNVTLTMAKEAGIDMSFLQRLTLASHICAMVERSRDGGEIPDVDSSFFSEVSEESLELAQGVCDLLPNLEKGEKYFLSIHFETARLSNE